MAGLMQEMLGRVPEVGDECHWAGLALRAIEIPERGQLVIELTTPAEPPDGTEEPSA